MWEMTKSETIGEVAARSRIRAREIDGADHDVRRAGLRSVCLICGRRVYNNPTTPYAPVHRAEEEVR